MNSNIHLRKTSLSEYFKAISHYFRFNGPTRCTIIDRTNFTEFGGELRDQQRPALERNDMKLGPFYQQKNKGNINMHDLSEWNLLFWRLDLAYFREKKDLGFDDLPGPVK